MAVDVTERKRAEEGMRLASLVFQNSSEGMTVTDADGAIISINPAFTQLTGYAPDEAIGKTPRILKSGR
ncbi:MAG: PAS domain S-box protein, partial [Methylobacter sp.]|nr:PAS domain S-box protein [Methylobacter sp.]